MLGGIGAQELLLILLVLLLLFGAKKIPEIAKRIRQERERVQKGNAGAGERGKEGGANS